jgi:hypothetical protein
MNFRARSWWFLLGAVFVPLGVLAVLLESSRWMPHDLELRLWIWSSWTASLAAGVVCVWRLPLGWDWRLVFSALYALFAGYYLLMAADRWFASLA